MADLNALTDEVLSHQFSPAQYDTYVRGRLNQAEQTLAAEIDFRASFTPYTIPVAAGTSSYDLPDNFDRVYTVKITQGNDTQPVTQQDASDFSNLPVQSGTPTNYTIGNGTIDLWPNPDQEYTIILAYYGIPGTMGDTDSPTLPPAAEKVMIHWALVGCYERENDYNSAQYHLARYESEKEKLKGQAQYNSDDYSQAQQVGDDRTDILAPAPTIYPGFGP